MKLTGGVITNGLFVTEMVTGQRRVLTCTAVNAPAFRVEMGNTGRHYDAWRYPDASPAAGTPSATPAVVAYFVGRTIA